jgi:hypothetical protein
MSSFVASFSASSVGVVSGWSGWVRVERLSWVASSRSILAHCSDGRVRVCRVDRLGSSSDASQLTALLRQARDGGLWARFIAAGQNSSDRWFCGVELSA